MRNISFNVYSINELPKSAQKAAIEKYRWGICDNEMECADQDYRETLQRFMELTNCDVPKWQVGYCGYNFTMESDSELYYDFKTDESITAEYLTGKLLHRYVRNNIVPYLLEYKIYRKNGKRRCSKIIQTYDCPLTGMCYDIPLTDTIMDYYLHPNKYPGITYKKLLEICLDDFFQSWHEEYRYWAEDESAIKQEMEAREWEFTIDGIKY